MGKGESSAKTSGTTESGRLEETISGLTTSSSQLKLDEAGVQRIIEDILSGPGGLASIFQGEQTAGIFNSTVSAQAAGDLSAKLAGEIAKITGETVTSEQEDRLRKERTSKKSRTSEFETSSEVGFSP